MENTASGREPVFTVPSEYTTPVTSILPCEPNAESSLGALTRRLWGAAAATVTVHSALIAGSETDAAVITVCPAPTALTSPSAVTLATPESRDVKLTRLSVASAGRTAALSRTVSPAASVSACPLSVISAAGTPT